MKTETMTFARRSRSRSRRALRALQALVSGRAVLFALVILALVVASAGPALACPVCYGNAEGQMIDGAKASVAFMGVLVYALMGGGVAMVVVTRRRAARGHGDPAPPANDPREED